MPPSPKPIDALYVPGLPNKVNVTFDRLLTPAVLDLGNWDVWIDGANPPVEAASVLLTQAQLTLGPFGPVDGRNEVSYRPPPFDVTSLVGAVEAAAFEAYPVHV